LLSAVGWGTAAAVTISVVLGTWLAEVAVLPKWEALLSLVAAILVISMVVYMLKAAKHMRRDIGTRLEAAATHPGRAAWLGVFAFVVLMVTREGMETAFITASLFRQTDTSHFIAGALFGLTLAAALAWAWSRYGNRVNLALFFKVTSVFLVLFALQLVIYSFHEATEANILPLDNAYWHIATEPYGPEGEYGAALTYALVLVPAAWLLFAAFMARLQAAPPEATR
jgi:high-affinity iron transporter